MPFVPPNQQRQSTEGVSNLHKCTMNIKLKVLFFYQKTTIRIPTASLPLGYQIQQLPILRVAASTPMHIQKQQHTCHTQEQHQTYTVVVSMAPVISHTRRMHLRITPEHSPWLALVLSASCNTVGWMPGRARGIYNPTPKGFHDGNWQIENDYTWNILCYFIITATLGSKQ